MSHQPFETWLLDETALTTEQKADLELHLAGCVECRRLQTGWQAASASLRAAPMAGPLPGFHQRFKASLAERKARRAHQLQIRWLITILIVGLVGTAALLGMMLFSILTPSDLLVGTAQILTGLIGWWNRVQTFLIAALQQPAVLALWILLSSGICLVIFGWLYTLWRISNQGAQK